MLPVIVRLGAVKLAKAAANDAGRALVARNVKGRFVPLAKAVANDKHDYTAKTLDRIMSRHNGHGRPLSAAANAPTPYEKTMDRIMQRHNGHEGHESLTPEAANDTKHRIFHNPAGPILQARPRERNWEPYEEKPLQLRTRYSGEEQNSAKLNERGSRDTQVLRRIEKNTERSSKLLEQILKAESGRNDGMGVDSLRAREMALEGRQGNRPWDRNTNSGMDSQGKEKEKSEWAKKLEAIKSLKGNAMGALGAMAGGGVGLALTKWAGVDDKKQNPVAPGGGHTGKEQAPTRKADDPKRNAAAPPPKPAPTAKPLPPVVEPPKAAKPVAKPDVMGQTEITSGKLTDREKAFVKMIMSSEGAPSIDASFGDGNGDGKGSRYITPQKMFGGRKLSELSVKEVIQFQEALTKDTRKKGWKGRKNSNEGTSAVGLGQFIKPTLIQTLKSKEFGYTDKDFETLKLDKDLQARMIVHILAHKRKLSLKEIDKWSDSDLVALGKEWESLDVSKGKLSKDELKRRLKEVAKADPSRITPSGKKPAEKPQGSYIEGTDVWMSDRSRSRMKPGDAAEIKKIFAQQSRRASSITPMGSGQGGVTVNVNNNGGKQQAPPRKAPEKRRTPPAKPAESWSQLAKKYFGW